MHHERRTGTGSLFALSCAVTLTSSATLAQGTLSPAPPLAVERSAGLSYRLVLPELFPDAVASEVMGVSGGVFVGTCDGTALGAANPSTYPLAVLWRGPDDIVFLAGEGVSVSSSNDMNSSGVVVGSADEVPGVDTLFGVPFVWKDGVLGVLPRLSEHALTFPHAVNERGQIVGESGDRAVLWSGGAIHDLGSPAWVVSQAYDIDRAGRIVGTAYGPDAMGVAVQWLPAGSGANGAPLHVAVELGSLGGTIAIATSINDAGQIAGFGTLADVGAGRRAFVFEDGALQQLEGLTADSDARAIGPSGAIVGRSGFQAVLWTAEDRQPIDLNDVTANLDGWLLTVANDIDASGRIAGVAVDEFGFGRACLLEPIPPSLEPPETVTKH